MVNISLVIPEATDSAFIGDGVKATVAHPTETGFSIVLEQPVPRDLTFHWIAVAVDNPTKTVSGSYDGTPAHLESPEASGSATPSPTLTPDEISTASATLSGELNL